MAPACLLAVVSVAIVSIAIVSRARLLVGEQLGPGVDEVEARIARLQQEEPRAELRRTWMEDGTGCMGYRQSLDVPGWNMGTGYMD